MNDNIVSKKGNRKPNWTSDECLSLVQLVESKKDVIRGKFSSKITSEEKKRAWLTITESINVSHPRVIRSTDEVEKKWYNILSKSRQDIAAFRRGMTGTGGGQSTAPLSAVASTVESILVESNVSISGIVDGLDSTMLQFLSPCESAIREELDCVDPVQDLGPFPVAAAVPVTVTDRKRELEVKVLEAQLEYYQLKIRKIKITSEK